MNTVIALSVDGNVNSFSKNAKDMVRTKVGPWPVSYRKDVLDRLRSLISRDDVTAVWLTRWVSDAALLATLENRLAFEGLVNVRAPFPVDDDDPAFAGAAGREAHLRDFWKFRSWDLVLQDLKPDRAAWLDDDLGKAKCKGVETYRPQITSDRFIYRTHNIAGLIHADMDKLEAWIDS